MDFIKLMASQKDLIVPVVDKSEKQRESSVPSHHGAKECNEHGDELLESPYVKRILNSLHFDSSDKNYISRINEDLSIEIRLHWTTRGHGIVISTSAKDLVQAHWIANLLKEKYDRK